MNTPDTNDELPPELRRALNDLPREQAPGDLLEERTVRALRERGLVDRAPGRTLRRVPRSWMGGAVAAGLALFASGLAAGQWMGARSTENVVTAIQAENSRHAALLVQQTGSAYVHALEQLASVQDTAGAAQGKEGREVAVRILRAAADELVRIAPDDPVASAVLAGFQKDTARQGSGAEKQRVVWF